MADIRVGPPRRVRIQGSAGAPQQQPPAPQPVQQQPPPPPDDFGPLDEARQRMGFSSPQPQPAPQQAQQPIQVQGQPPALDLRQLQAHAARVGGTPGEAPSYAQPDATAPVAIGTPGPKTPPGRGTDLPNGAGYQVDNTVYRSSDDYSDQRAGRIMQDMQRAGMMGVQNGLYAPTGDDQAAMLGQQMANYNRGAGNFAQAMAAQGDEEKQALAKQLGLGHLGVEQGKLTLEGQKAQSADAIARAEIASKEAMLGRSLTSQEKQEAMKAAATVEGHVISGKAQLGAADINQRGMRGASMDALIMQGLGDLNSMGGDQVLSKVKNAQAVRDLVQYERGSPAGGGGIPGLSMSPQMSQILGEYLPQYQTGGQGNIPVGAPPPVQVQGPGGTRPFTQPGENPEDVIKRMGSMQNKPIDQRSFLSNFGVATDPKTGIAGYSPEFSKLGTKGLIEKLSSYVDPNTGTAKDIPPEHLDALLQHARSAGMNEADLQSEVAKSIIRENRNLGDENKGGYTHDVGDSSLATAAKMNPWIAAGAQLFGGGGNDLTLKDRQGNPVFKGRESTGVLGIPQMASGTLDVTPNVRGKADENSRKQRAAASLLMDRILAAKAAQK